MAWHASLLFVPSHWFSLNTWYCIIRAGLGWRDATWPKSLWIITSCAEPIKVWSKSHLGQTHVWLVFPYCKAQNETMHGKIWTKAKICDLVQSVHQAIATYYNILLHHLQMNGGHSRRNLILQHQELRCKKNIAATPPPVPGEAKPMPCLGNKLCKSLASLDTKIYQECMMLSGPLFPSVFCVCLNVFVLQNIILYS